MIGNANWKPSQDRRAIIEHRGADGEVAWVPLGDHQAPWRVEDEHADDPRELSTAEFVDRFDDVSDAAKEVLDAARESTLERIDERSSAAAAEAESGHHEDARAIHVQVGELLRDVERFDEIAGEL